MISAALVALYIRPSNCGLMPEIEAMLMIGPAPRAHIPGATRRTRRNALFRLTSIILSNCASSTPRQGPWATLVAALFTRMSAGPKSRVTPSTQRASSSGLPTWQALGITFPPSSAATSSSDSCLRPQITVVAPSRANAAAMALPMPRLPPVTRATFPSSSMLKFQAFQIVAERTAEIVPAEGEFDRGFQKAQLVAGVVAAAFEAAGVDGPAAQQVLQ